VEAASKTNDQWSNPDRAAWGDCPRCLLLANQIAAATRAHPRGMDRPWGNIAAITHTVGLRLSGHRERHLAFEDDVRRQVGVRVVGIMRVRRVLPNIGMRETLRLELLAILGIVKRWHLRLGDYINRAECRRKLGREQVCEVRCFEMAVEGILAGVAWSGPPARWGVVRG